MINAISLKNYYFNLLSMLKEVELKGYIKN